jgi:hypothetical protein
VQKRRYVVIVIASCVERSRHEVIKGAKWLSITAAGLRNHAKLHM